MSKDSPQGERLSAESDGASLTDRSRKVREDAARTLWAWGWYDLAEVVAKWPARPDLVSEREAGR